MLNFTTNDTQYTITFSKYEIFQITGALRAVKSTTSNHDINRLCSALLDAFNRSLIN